MRSARKPVPLSRGGVRQRSAAALEQVLASRSPADAVIERAATGLDERDRRLLVELVLGTLRWLRRLDDVIERASSRSLEKIDPNLLAPLRIAVYQLLFLDRIPPHAAVSEAVDEAKRRSHRGGAGFVNALARRVAASSGLDAWAIREKDPLKALAIETSHPDFLVRRWDERFGRVRTRALLRGNNSPRSVHLLALAGAGELKAVAERLALEGVETRASRLSPRGLIVTRGDALASEEFLRGGNLYVQDEASQAAALIPPPRPGEWILDAAASPGGKGFSVLAAEPSARVVSGDASIQRLDRLVSNQARLGVVTPTVVSKAQLPAFKGGFDRILIDLPCSGTGTLRKHPELKWRVTGPELERLSRQAYGMLEGVAPLVRPGGLLIAITCSLEPEENEQAVSRLRERQPEFTPLELEGRLGPDLAAHIEAPGRWRVLTDEDHDGFTVSVLERKV